MSRTEGSTHAQLENRGLAQITIRGYYQEKNQVIRNRGCIDTAKAINNIRFLIINPRGISS